MSSSMSSAEGNADNVSAVSTPPSSPTSFFYNSPNKSRKRFSADILRGYYTRLQATQSIIESASYKVLDDNELEWIKMEHSHLSYKVQLHTQRLETEYRVREAMQAVHVDDAQLSHSTNKIDDMERFLSRHRSRLLDLQTQLLQHNAGILAKYIHSQKLLQPQPTPSQLDSRHFHVNNDRAWRYVGKAQRGSPKEVENHAQSAHLNGEREWHQATLAENESLQRQLREHIESSQETSAQEAAVATQKLKTAIEENNKYQQLLHESQASTSRQAQHSDNLQNRLQSLLDDFSQIVSTRDAMTGSIDRLCRLLDTHSIAYTKSPHNPLETFTSAISSIEAQLLLLKENSTASEQMAFLTSEKDTMRQRFDYYEHQVQQLSDVIANQTLDMERQKQAFSGVVGEQKQRIAGLEEQLGEANLRAKQMESDVAFYKDSNGAYEQELKNKEEGKHNSGVSASEEKMSIQVLKGLWNIIPNSTQRSSNERLIESSSAALSQLDVDKLKQVLERSKERNFEKYDLKAFVGRVKVLIDDNRLFIERILHNAETANLYKSNAEKAHKLALDFKNALEAYKKQVLDLQNNLAQAAKRDAEIRKDRENLREQISQLERDMSKQQQGGEVDKLRKSLVNREDEIQAFRQMQMDKSIGMLDELNSLQIEVTELRQKLRQKG